MIPEAFELWEDKRVSNTWNARSVSMYYLKYGKSGIYAVQGKITHSVSEMCIKCGNSIFNTWSAEKLSCIWNAKRVPSAPKFQWIWNAGKVLCTLIPRKVLWTWNAGNVLCTCIARRVLWTWDAGRVLCTWIARKVLCTWNAGGVLCTWIARKVLCTWSAGRVPCCSPPRTWGCWYEEHLNNIRIWIRQAYSHFTVFECT